MKVILSFMFCQFLLCPLTRPRVHQEEKEGRIKGIAPKMGLMKCPEAPGTVYKALSAVEQEKSEQQSE
jgi:hypothetical protein